MVSSVSPKNKSDLKTIFMFSLCILSSHSAAQTERRGIQTVLKQMLNKINLK